MGLARRIAHLSYRSEAELEIRFGRDEQPGEDPLSDGRFAVESYLDHQADKLARRFDANTYLVLTEAMNTHDLGRDRGGVQAVLANVRVPMVIGGVYSDRLYPLRLQREIAELVPTCDGVRVVHAPYGHDSFLIEVDGVGPIIQEALGRVPVGAG